MHARLKIEPTWAWYYRISSNSRTLMILLQIDPAFGNELETVYEACYETKDTSIFAWFLIFDIGHYCWLHGPICRLLPNNKVDYSHHSTHLRFPIVMNYHYGITQDLTNNCNFSLRLSIIWINVSFIMKLLLPLAPYHIIYWIVKLFQIFPLDLSLTPP